MTKLKRGTTKLFAIIMTLALIIGFIPVLAPQALAAEITSTLDLSAMTESVTNAADGWAWVHDTLTLTLSGINIQTADAKGISLPDGATIVLTDGTTNNVQATNASSGSMSAGIFSLGALTINGSGTLKATGGSVTGSYGISAGICSGNGLTIEGSGALEATSGPITGSGVISSGIYVNAGLLTIEGSGTLATIGGSVTDNGTINTVSYSSGIYSNDIITIGDTGNPTVTATGGFAENTGNFGSCSSIGIYTQGHSLTIGSTSSGGNPTVTATGGAAELGGSTGIGSEGSFTINGGTVTATGGRGLSSEGVVSLDNGLDINGGTLTATGGSATSASYGIRTIWAGFQNSGGTVMATGGSVTDTSGINYGICCGHGTTTYNITLDSGLTIAKSTSAVGTAQAMNVANSGTQSLLSPSTGDYTSGFNVYGVSATYTVLEDTVSYTPDTLVSAIGNTSYASYDSGTQTLYLGNVIINSTNAKPLVMNAGDNISLTGTVVISSGDVSSSDSTAIYGAGALTISGSGTLVAIGGTATDTGYKSCGISADGGVTISGGITVNATGSAAGAESHGIYSGGTFTASDTATVIHANASTATISQAVAASSITMSSPLCVISPYGGGASSSGAYIATESGGTTAAANVTIFQTLPIITTQPQASTITAKSASAQVFTVSAEVASSYQWQVNSGSGWSDLADTAPYSGTTTSTLSIANATTAISGYQYRVKVTNMVGTTISTAATLTVNAKALTAAMIGDISAQSYTGSAIEPTVTVTDSEALVLNTDYTVSYTDNTNVGTATVTVTGMGSYTGTQTKTFAINKSDYTGTAVTGTKLVIERTAQAGAVFDLTSLDFPASFTNISYTGASETSDTGNVISNVAISGTSLTFDVAAVEPGAADATINVTVDSDNYNPYTIVGTVQVTSKTPVTITGITADDAAYTGSPYVLTANNPTNSDGYTGTYNYAYVGTGSTSYGPSETAPTDAGTYKLTVSVPNSNATYKGSSVNTFEITKLPLTVKPSSYTITQGDPLPTPTVVYDGLLSSDDGATVATLASGNFDMEIKDTDGVTALADSNTPGTYAIKFVGSPVFDTAANYTISTADGTLTITQQSHGGGSSGGGSTTPDYNAQVTSGNGDERTLPITVDTDAGTASVDAQSIAQDGTIITIPSVPDVDTYIMGIPVSELSRNDTQKTLTVNTDNGSISIPSNMFTGVSGISGSTAEISIGQGNTDNLPDNLKAAIGDRPLIQLALSIDGNQTDWSNPDVPDSLYTLYPDCGRA